MYRGQHVLYYLEGVWVGGPAPKFQSGPHRGWEGVYYLRTNLRSSKWLRMIQMARSLSGIPRIRPMYTASVYADYGD